MPNFFEIVFYFVILFLLLYLFHFLNKRFLFSNKCSLIMTSYVMILLSATFFYLKNEDLSSLVALATTIIKNTSQLSTISLLVVFCGFVLYAFLCHKKQSDDAYSALLTRLLIGSFTASTIPTGISLILCALVDITLLKDMAEGLGVYIAYAGLSLISMTILLIFEEKKRIEKLSKNDNHNN